MNQERLIPLSAVRGVVSTGQLWYFYELIQDGAKFNFFESKVYELQVDNFTKVVEIVYWLLLKAWDDAAAAFEIAKEKQLDELDTEKSKMDDHGSEEYQAIALEILEATEQRKRAKARRDHSQNTLIAARAATNDSEAEAVVLSLKNSFNNPNLYKLV